MENKSVVTDEEMDKVHSFMDKFVKEFDGERMEVLVTYVEALSHLVFSFMARNGYETKGLCEAIDVIAETSKKQLLCIGEPTEE